jgi:DNA-binding NtrC family response regulator
MSWKNFGWMPNDTIFTLINNLKDAKSLEVKKKIDHIAKISASVLFYGETGVGKDIWAAYLGKISQTDGFLNLHCGDVPENLLESEWFGYKKGAFSGADRDHAGRWKQAANGILFLNQIDLLNLNMQSKLLRIIERKKYYPLGANQEESIRARFLFSADALIRDKVRQGLFREDLFYRISSYCIFIPPLRDRQLDIVPLIRFYASKKNVQLNLDGPALKMLKQYPWPGNIRELEGFVNNAAVLNNCVNAEDVFELVKTPGDFIESYQQEDWSLAELEKEYIQFLLKKHKNKSKVASILKISRKSLYNKLFSYENI